MSEKDSILVLAILVLIGLGAAGASWEAGRRHALERHQCPPQVDWAGPLLEDCAAALERARAANEDCAAAVRDVASQQEGCRRFFELGQAEVRR